MTELTAPPRTPDADLPLLARPAEAVQDSLVVSTWTLVSRVTGLARVVVLGAVVGPTLFGNLYQASSTLPQTVYYGLLGGSLISSLLVPAMVRWVDEEDPGACGRLAGGFLGILALGLAVVLPALLLVTPHLLAATSPAGADTAEAERVARWLLVLFLPQVFLYAVAGCSAAVLHARRRFALAAAAPAVENLGCIATLLLASALYGGTLGRSGAPLQQLLVLGGGTTAAVALHAALQWYGAWRCGVAVRPRAGWLDREVVVVLRRSARALAYSALGAVQLLAVLLVTNSVTGGVVAVQIALNFYFLPIALGATPVALSLLPRLSRLTGDPRLLRDTAVRGLRFAFFLTLPAAVVLGVLAPGLAEAVSFGQMDTPQGRLLLTVALTALAVGLAGEAAFLVGTYGAYARGDTSSPLRAMGTRCAVCAAVLVLAAEADGTAVVLLAAGAMSLGAVAGAAQLLRALLRGLPLGDERLGSSTLRIGAAAAVMVLPMLAARLLLEDAAGAAQTWTGHLLAVVLGGTVFIVVAGWLRVPEAGWLGAALRGARPGAP